MSFLFIEGAAVFQTTKGEITKTRLKLLIYFRLTVTMKRTTT